MESYPLANAESVVARARSGDPAAFEALYRAFESPVYNLARRICRTTEDAEDAGRAPVPSPRMLRMVDGKPFR
mgnify:CR=1 FL=1